MRINVPGVLAWIAIALSVVALYRTDVARDDVAALVAGLAYVVSCLALIGALDLDHRINRKDRP